MPQTGRANGESSTLEPGLGLTSGAMLVGAGGRSVGHFLTAQLGKGLQHRHPSPPTPSDIKRQSKTIHTHTEHPTYTGCMHILKYVFKKGLFKNTLAIVSLAKTIRRISPARTLNLTVRCKLLKEPHVQKSNPAIAYNCAFIGSPTPRLYNFLIKRNVTHLNNKLPPSPRTPLPSLPL